MRVTMAMTVCRSVALALAVVCFSFLPALAADKDCVYTVYVRTGSIWKAGTDSTVSMEFFDSDYSSIYIQNLTAWGGNLQGQERDYFERGNVDIFSGLGDCLTKPICGLNVTSDGMGDHHGWYVDYVEVTFTGAHLPCLQTSFSVSQWLATDAYPYTLTYEYEKCSDSQTTKQCGDPHSAE